ncbi:SMI1/KNR4 family protein [Rhizobium leguminosarum]|uniref:SMI1-KNR4 cell-wall family protein n=1 Tax=Rhizobium leguminosarum TaxID=384 RepID=A0A2Z4YJE2_RHILE|nr:SMI1/KNR4 family protein [Rhizobium leguminosarum]AXA41600.1 SMI1-KNR4 cell-wall family protein [Rhizobium leguminosarum]
MTILLYDDAIRALRENDVPILGTTGATEENIKQIQVRLGVSLPPSYRKMLSDFGALEFGTKEFYGWLSQGIDAKFATNVVYTTERERCDGRISGAMVPFLTSGYGPFFVIDCTEIGLDGEAAIYEVSPAGYERGKDRVADSFGAFLIEEVDRVLQTRDDGHEFEEEITSPSPQRTRRYWKERAKDFE